MRTILGTLMALNLRPFYHPSLQELGLSNDKIGGDVDFNSMPEQFGTFAPSPIPGRYRLKLPEAKLLQTVFDKVTASKGERVQMNFDNEHPLIIVQSPGGYMNGEPFTTRISNVERARGKEKIEVSDWDYLLRVLGATSKPHTNPDYVKAILPFAGREFGAELEYQFSCNPNKDIRVDSGDGSLSVVDGVKGCGARYYQNQLKDLKVDGKWPDRIICNGQANRDGQMTQCGASLRAFTIIAAFVK